MIFADILAEDIVLVQNGEHLVLLHYFDGTASYEVKRCQIVALVNKGVARRCVRRLELEREHFEATLAGVLKRRTLVEQLPVQVEANVGL